GRHVLVLESRNIGPIGRIGPIGPITAYRLGPPPPAPRGALPNPGGVDCVDVRVAPEICCPVITMSPSFRLPSTTSVAEPSLRPVVILRRSGLPSWPSTQTTRI